MMHARLPETSLEAPEPLRPCSMKHDNLDGFVIPKRNHGALIPLLLPVSGAVMQGSTCSFLSTQLVASASTCLFTDLHSDRPSGSEVRCSLYLWKGGCPGVFGGCHVISKAPPGA